MFRADRLATLYFFHPLRQFMPPRPGSIPVLMYHSISEPANTGLHPYFETATSPRVFAEQIKFLYENGYQTVTLAAIANRNSKSEIGNSKLETRNSKFEIRDSKTVPWLPLPTACRLVTGDRRVVITFDDGFQDFYTHAFPVLNRFGCQATMFLPTAFIGEAPHKFKGADCLTWSQVRELHEAGVCFGSHTVNHPKLTEVAPTQREYELRQSKLMIEDKLGCAVDSFAYPYAFPATNQPFTQCLRAMLEDAGYRNGVSTVVGTADSGGDMFFMKRLPVNSYDDLSLFQAKLEGGYDWTSAPQYLWKQIARTSRRRRAGLALASRRSRTL